MLMIGPPIGKDDDFTENPDDPPDPVFEEALEHQNLFRAGLLEAAGFMGSAVSFPAPHGFRWA
jgi:hypothetical protein